MSEIPGTDFSFPAAYHADVLQEIPGHGPTTVEMSKDGRVVDGGILFEVVNEHGRVWRGLAARGRETVRHARSGLYSTPSPNRLCVIARGAAYLVDTDEPERWQAVADFPIISVAPAVADARLVLATPQYVCAVDDTGLAWRSARLATDGISLDGTDDGWIHGIADPSGIESREFCVNLATGVHRGGFVFAPRTG